MRHIGFVVEGPTDYAVLKEIVARFLGEEDFVAQALYPEMSDALQVQPNQLGWGWPGVYHWCRQCVDQAGGPVRNHVLLTRFDALVVQLDADVGDSSYAEGHITEPDPGLAPLPCAAPCPPPSATTDPLRAVLLSWLGEATVPFNVVFCTPSKALETWVIAGLYPDDPILGTGRIECRSSPNDYLQGKPSADRLIASGKKITERYKACASTIATNWEAVKARCTEAGRFEQDFSAALQ